MPIKRTMIKTRISLDTPWEKPTLEWMQYRKNNYIDTGKIIDTKTTFYDEYGAILNAESDYSKMIKSVVTFIDNESFEEFRRDKNLHQLCWPTNEIVKVIVEEI